jgi:hypothetical protein
VAIALEAVFGKFEFQVSTSMTKIWDFENKVELRFSTPTRLAEAIREYDLTGNWVLPVDLYYLGRMPVSSWKKIKKAKPQAAGKVIVRQKPARTRAAATRSIMRTTRVNWTGATLLK